MHDNFSGRKQLYHSLMFQQTYVTSLSLRRVSMLQLLGFHWWYAYQHYVGKTNLSALMCY